MDDDLLTLAEVASMLRRPEGTLRQWRHRSYGPSSFRVGGHVMYRRNEVTRWLRAQEEATGGGYAA